MFQLTEEYRAVVRCHIAWLPTACRTTEAQLAFQSLRTPAYVGRPFPTALDPFTCNRYELAEFGAAAYDLGARYLGVCCGAGPHHIRALAEAVGRMPPASAYTADMSKHAFLGTDPTLRPENQDYAEQL